VNSGSVNPVRTFTSQPSSLLGTSDVAEISRLAALAQLNLRHRKTARTIKHTPRAGATIEA